MLPGWIAGQLFLGCSVASAGHAVRGKQTFRSTVWCAREATCVRIVMMRKLSATHYAAPLYFECMYTHVYICT